MGMTRGPVTMICAVLLALALAVTAAPAAHAEVVPKGQCYKLGATRTVQLGDVVCRESGTMWRWELVPSKATAAGARYVLGVYWDTGFSPTSRVDYCRRFNRFPKKVMWEVAQAYYQFPKSTMLPAADRFFTRVCA